MQPYDIIGDIHGHADELEALLSRLGYLEIAGRYRHPGGRKVIFLGDYLDRGPKIRRVLQIVRAMVDEGDALAILGNHEINALRYHTLDRDGQPLRAHTAANRRQHEATLSQLATAHSGEWREWQRWLARLPLSLDLGGLRIVHAAWEDAAVLELSKIRCWEGEALERYSIKGSPEHSVSVES